MGFKNFLPRKNCSKHSYEEGQKDFGPHSLKRGDLIGRKREKARQSSKISYKGWSHLQN
jgi:hypothetical protein